MNLCVQNLTEFLFFLFSYCKAGSVVLLDATTMQEIFSFEVQRILFYAHGIADSSEAACFAFTWSHGDSQESAIFQCHVFRCDIPEAVSSDLDTLFYEMKSQSLRSRCDKFPLALPRRSCAPRQSLSRPCCAKTLSPSSSLRLCSPQFLRSRRCLRLNSPWKSKKETQR